VTVKQRSTTPVSKSFATRACVIAATILTLTLSPLTLAPVAKADRYDEQIRAIQSQIDHYNAQASELSQQADSYARELGSLNNQKAQIQAQLNLSVAKADKLTEQIKQNEKKIKENKTLLGKTIADLYIDDKISPLEMLASSKSIAEYVDKQANREQIQQSVRTTIKEIKTLKKQLEKQKVAVDQEISNQTFAREQLAAKEAEVASLMAQVQGQEANYRSLSEQSRAQKDQVQRQQQAAIEAAMRRSGGGGSAVAGDPNKGGYPSNLANSDYYNPVVDPWGMYSRQCVSYTAWKVYQKNGSMPYWGGRGNANQWPGNARAAGIPVSSVPRAGSVGVLMEGQYGHVVWVESVNSNGTINISQYNYYNAGGPGWGHYSEMYNVSPNAYDYYIYF
jgi:surface antigen